MPRCPSCFTPLTRVEENAIQSFTCSNCFGTWIGNLSLMRRTRAEAAAEAAPTSSPDGPPPIPTAPPATLEDLIETVQASDTKKVLRCAQCEKEMAKERFHPMIPVNVDHCQKCDWFWLDAGELALLERLYAELMNSNDPEIVRRREKVAAAMGAWDRRPTATEEAERAVNEALAEGQTAASLLRMLLLAI
jgi:Zn-finger nucleic acid-binding protein